MALEKLHGAQLVIAIHGDALHVGKRKAWLAPADDFFGWQVLAGELSQGIRAVARAAAATQLVAYGELVERPVIKRKLPEFDDDRFTEAVVWHPGPLTEGDLVIWAERMVQPARLASARSKVGADPAAIVDEVALDVAVDLGLAFRDAWDRLGTPVQDRILARARLLATQLLA